MKGKTLSEVFAGEDAERKSRENPLADFVKIIREKLPPPEKLELLAEWFDGYDGERRSLDNEVQTDLRIWAMNIRQLIALISTISKKFKP